MRLAVLMKSTNFFALTCFILISSLTCACAAEEGKESAKPAEKKAAAKDSASEKKAKKFSGRLPVFYGDVVSGEQREKIYAIQESYVERLDALVAQVKALQAQQMSEIEAVLTEEQKKKVDALKAAALEKRKARAAEAEATAKAETK